MIDCGYNLIILRYCHVYEANPLNFIAFFIYNCMMNFQEQALGYKTCDTNKKKIHNTLFLK